MASSSSITLSIGGVDFVLQPDVNKDSSRLKIDKLSGEGATVHLNNFCGVLRVVRNENGLFSQHGSQLDDNSLANEVENVPSPQVEKDVLGNKQPDPKGQTKLNFRRQSATSATLPSLDNRLKTHPAQTASRPQNDVSHTSKRKHEAGQDSTVVEKKMRPQTKATEEKSADTVSYGKSEAAGGNLHDKPDIFGDLKNSSLGQTMPSQDNESYALSADSSIGKLIPANKRNAKEIVPHGRWGQTMTMIDHRRLVVYGGQTMTGSSPETLSDLYIYDILDKVRAVWHSSVNVSPNSRAAPSDLEQTDQLRWSCKNLALCKFSTGATASSLLRRRDTGPKEREDGDHRSSERPRFRNHAVVPAFLQR